MLYFFNFFNVRLSFFVLLRINHTLEDTKRKWLMKEIFMALEKNENFFELTDDNSGE